MHSTSISSRFANDFSKNKIFLKFNSNVNKIINVIYLWELFKFDYHY